MKIVKPANISRNKYTNNTSSAHVCSAHTKWDFEHRHHHRHRRCTKSAAHCQSFDTENTRSARTQTLRRVVVRAYAHTHIDLSCVMCVHESSFGAA